MVLSGLRAHFREALSEVSSELLQCSLGLVWVDQTKTFDSLGLAADSIEACERNLIVKSNLLSSDSLYRAGVEQKLRLHQAIFVSSFMLWIIDIPIGDVEASRCTTVEV